MEKSSGKINYENTNLEIFWLWLSDLLCYVISVGLVTAFRILFFPVKSGVILDTNVVRTIITAYLLLTSILIMRGLYPGRGRISVLELKQLTESILIAYGIMGAIIFLQGNLSGFSRSVFLLTGIISIVVIAFGRFIIRKIFASNSNWGEPVVILGLYKEILRVSKKLSTCQRIGYRPVVGLAVDEIIDEDSRKIPIFPWSASKQEEIIKANINTNILAIPIDLLALSYPDIYNSAAFSFRKTIFILDDAIYGNMMGEAVDLNGLPGVISKQSLLSKSQKAVKLLLDIILCAIIFFPTLILSGLISVCIAIDSPGPVLYKHKRIGIKGKPFDIFKFRTMYVDSDERLMNLLKDPEVLAEWSKYHKLKSDPRITRVGYWLRKFSLDELPQFINIIRGEMSLIGPRPLIQAEIDELGEISKIILTIKPGITGWWQVMGRNNLSFDERKEHDTYYVFNWNIWLDLFILFKTFWILLFARSEG